MPPSSAPMAAAVPACTAPRMASSEILREITASLPLVSTFRDSKSLAASFGSSPSAGGSMVFRESIWSTNSPRALASLKRAVRKRSMELSAPDAMRKMRVFRSSDSSASALICSSWATDSSELVLDSFSTNFMTPSRSSASAKMESSAFRERTSADGASTSGRISGFASMSSLARTWTWSSETIITMKWAEVSSFLIS